MASYKCLDVMCGLEMVAEDEGQTEPCPKCGSNMEEFFPEITACDVPPEQNAADASPLAKAISAKFTN